MNSGDFLVVIKASFGREFPFDTDCDNDFDDSNTELIYLLTNELLSVDPEEDLIGADFEKDLSTFSFSKALRVASITSCL